MDAAELRRRVAKLDEAEYALARASLAEEAGIGVGQLDRVRSDATKPPPAKSRAAAEPWPVPVDGEKLAAGIEKALRRFVVLDDRAYVLVTLWAVGTHCYSARGVWPLLLARSPQPACGKSTLLDVLERLVAQPFVAGNASLATLFRSAASGPTQLLDELDRWLERDPEVVGFLCAGWQVGRPFVRCEPDTLELREFPCYAPKALALIGEVRDEALRSRCVVVEMRRALPGERAERFRAARAYPELRDLQAQAARWAADHAAEVGAFELADDALQGLSGRAADNGEALLAVAEAIGGAWPQRARAALTGAPADDSQDLGAMLLADLRDLLKSLPANAEAIATPRILDHLLALADRPWPTFRRDGKPIEANGLRRRLSPFGVRPDRYSINGVQVRGYALAPLREAIARYLPPPPPSDPPDEASTASSRLNGEPRDALSAPQAPFGSRLGGKDTSPGGPGGGASRAHAAALESLRAERAHYAAVLVADGMEEDEAERVAAEFVADSDAWDASL